VGSELVSAGVKNCLLFTSSRPALGPTEPLIHWVPGALSPGLELPRGKAELESLTSSEVGKTWICTSIPP
jgi:hypothetical protein